MNIINLPNFLTIARILLIPVFAYYFLQGQYGLALILFIGTGLTDAIDGALARLLKERTTLGAIIDPAADKLVMLVSFIILSMRGMVPIWVTILVILRDVYIVVGMGILKLFHRKIRLGPSILSKCNTFFQLLTIFLAFSIAWLRDQSWALPYLEYLIEAFWVVLFIAVGMTIASGIQYTWIGVKILKTPKGNGTVSLKKG